MLEARWRRATARRPTSATVEVLARVADGDAIVGPQAAGARVGGDARGLRDARRQQVVEAHARQAGEGGRVVVGLAVVDQPQVVVAALVQERARLLDVDVAAQDVRDLAALGVGRVGLEAPVVALEQQVGRARRGDPLVGVRLGQPVQLVADARSRRPPRRCSRRGRGVRASSCRTARGRPDIAHDQHAGAVARLERPDAQEREAPVAVARHRPAGAEQRPVEVDVQAAHAGIVAGVSGRRMCACPAACRSGARSGGRSRPTAATGSARARADGARRDSASGCAAGTAAWSATR